jgi:hypothetical protein
MASVKFSSRDGLDWHSIEDRMESKREKESKDG